jgi:glucan phosphoethanolaminetransferase (alkaline phosphatase superfamily)
VTKPGNSDPAEPKDETAAETPDTPETAAAYEKAPPVREEPVMPTAAEAARHRSELPRPKIVRIAFYLAIASGVVGLFSALDLFLNKAELVRSAQTLKTAKPLTAAEAEKAVTSLLWLYLVVVIALGAFLVLFAYKAQDGLRRARMMALIIALILLLFHFYFFGTAYGQISGLFAAITIALLYLPSTRAYFGPRQRTR